MSRRAPLPRPPGALTAPARTGVWTFSSWPNATTRTAEILVVALLYFITASLSLRLALEKTNASPVWPPSGIALAAVLLIGLRVWPGILLGAVVANVVAFLGNQAADLRTILPASAVIGIGNALEAVVGGLLIRRWTGTPAPFTRAPDAVRFIGATLVACLVSSAIGPTAVAVAGIAAPPSYGTVWITWWLGDVTGMLTIAPLLILWGLPDRSLGLPHRRLEAAVLFVSLLVGTHIAFGGWPLDRLARYPVTFAVIPWLAWAAFRFGPREAVTAAAIGASIAVSYTVAGFGPFVRATVNESLLLLQAFVGVMTATILVMAAVVSERRNAQTDLRQARDTLETRVGERTRELARVNDALRTEISDRKGVEAATERRRQEVELLTDLVQGINASLEPDEVLQRLADGARELAQSDVAGVMLREPDSEAVVPRYVTGHGPDTNWTQLRVESGRGLAGQVLKTGRPWRTDDYAADPRFSKEYLGWVRAENLVAGILVPILIDGRVHGLLYLANRSARVFTDHDEAILVRLAEHAALAVRNARLLRDAERRRRAAESLAEVGRHISQSLHAQDVAQRIAESLRALLGVSVAVVFRLDSSAGHLVALGLVGNVGSAFGENMTVPVGEGGVGQAVSEGRVITSLNVLDDPAVTLGADLRPRVERAGYRAVLAVPLRIQDSIIGALGVGDRAGRIFDAEEIALAQAFADQAAIALENARLYERAQQAYEELSATQAQLLQTQKMEAVGRLAAGVAHDFNNLLTVMKGRSQFALKRLPSEHPIWRDIQQIEKSCDRATRVVDQLLAFSRKQILQPKVVDPKDLIGGMVDMLRRLMGEDIELTFVPAPDLGRVRADLGQLEQVIVNLAANARDAMPDGGRWTIETSNVTLDEAYASRHVGVRPGAYVQIAFTDTGVGMDATVRSRLFEPFFTTKELGKGTGLGLATVYGIVKQSGGNIWVYSEVGHGTTFKIYLPLVSERVDAIVPPEPSRPPQGGSETVLLVEDEDDVRELAAEMLRSFGYVVLAARRPQEALAICREHDGAIDLLLTDVVMPELNGHRLAERGRSGRQGMKVLYMSGYTDDAIVRHGVLQPGTHFLQKPFSADRLAQKVRDVLDGPCPRG